MKKINMLLPTIGLLFLSIGLISSSAQPQKEKGFNIHRGLNASHWLSQSKKRGEKRARYMQEEDFAAIVIMGFEL